MFRAHSIWSWTGSASGPSSQDYSGVTLHIGVSDGAGVSVASMRGVSGYRNFMWAFLSILLLV